MAAPARADRDALVVQVGRRIAEIRAARALTQEGLAAALGVSVKYYQRIERGRENATLESLARIAAVLRVPPLTLMEPPQELRPRRGRPRRNERSPGVGAGAAFRIVSEREPGSVPLLSLAAAAGLDGTAGVAETAAWVVPQTRRRLRAGMFVARVLGPSMEPKIHSGSFCLFDAGVTAAADGGIYLVELRDALDADTGSRYAVKRVERVVVRGRARLRLRSYDDDTPSVDLDPGPDDDPAVRIVARMLEVLGG